MAKTTAYRAAPSFNMSAWFAAAPGVTAIKSLRGSVVLEILETEKKISIDPNDLPKEPVETPLGKLITEKTAAGGYTLKIARPEDAAAAGPGALQVVMKSTNGRVQTFNTMNIYTGVSIDARVMPQTFELYFPEKVREVTVPILLENVTIMPERPPMRGGGGR
jgi:hypothetical protein